MQVTHSETNFQIFFLLRVLTEVWQPCVSHAKAANCDDLTKHTDCYIPNRLTHRANYQKKFFGGLQLYEKLLPSPAFNVWYVLRPRYIDA